MGDWNWEEVRPDDWRARCGDVLLRVRRDAPNVERWVPEVHTEAADHAGPACASRLRRDDEAERVDGGG
jgi:hypothetical protein